MALLLMKATNATHSDPTKDQRGCYKRGDVVDVYEDDAHNGDLTQNPIMPPFAMVRVRSGDVGSLRTNANAVTNTLRLGVGQGAQVPPAPWFAVLGSQPFSGTGEVVHVTAITGDDLTATRGVRGTTAQAWATGTPIERIITKAQAEKYIATHTEPGVGVVRRRLWWVLVDQLPSGILTDLQADRWVTVTWPEVRNFFQNKETGATEAEP